MCGGVGVVVVLGCFEDGARLIAGLNALLDLDVGIIAIGRNAGGDGVHAVVTASPVGGLANSAGM